MAVQQQQCQSHVKKLIRFGQSVIVGSHAVNNCIIHYFIFHDIKTQFETVNILINSSRRHQSAIYVLQSQGAAMVPTCEENFLHE